MTLVVSMKAVCNVLSYIYKSVIRIIFLKEWKKKKEEGRGTKNVSDTIVSFNCEIKWPCDCKKNSLLIKMYMLIY